MDSKIVKGFKWTAIERVVLQGVQFVLGVIIARLISPSEYGILGILMVFINLSQVFIDSGLGSALIYENKLDEKSLSTAFTFNLIVSIFFTVALYFSAPFIEQFYNLENLGLYIRVSSIVLLTNSLILVPTSILKIKLDFKSLAISNVLSTFGSGIVGVVMAYMGYGVWALIVQLIGKSVLQFIILYFLCRWIPIVAFYKNSFKSLYKYGVNVFATTMVTRITDEGIAFVLAKSISPYSLGIYTRGTQFANLPSSCLGSIINTVMFPSLSSIRDDKEKFDNLYKSSVEYQALLTTPFYILFAVIAKPVVLLLLTEKWIDVALVVQILCIGKIVTLVANITEQVIMARGRSDLFFRQQMLKMGSKVFCVVCAMPFGLIPVVLADGATTLFGFVFTNLCLPKEAKSFGIKQQIQLIHPYIVGAVVSGVVSYIVMTLTSLHWLQIVIATMAFCFSYYAIVGRIYKKPTLDILLKMIHSKICKS